MDTCKAQQAPEVNQYEALQAEIDFLRGELDKKHHQQPGWSGPVTTAYLRGYGEHPNWRAHAEQDRRKELVMRGWY